MRLYDAHNHLQDEWLAPHLAAITREPPAAAMVVNGTGEADWSAVASLARRFSWVRPSYGVHPWLVDTVSADWRERLTPLLDAGAGVGEIGLDRWKTEANFAAQQEIFRWQLRAAAERNAPVTIHCLRAWGAMEEALRAEPRPARGFLLHAYGGPAEMVRGFVTLGAHFSFSGSFLAPGRERKLDPFRVIPLERLLVETDAPAMPLAPEHERCSLPPTPTGERVNHPGNLVVAYEGLARLRGMPVAELAGIVEENFLRFFGSAAAPAEQGDPGAQPAS